MIRMSKDISVFSINIDSLLWGELIEEEEIEEEMI
jgi:hypothetical protein